MLAQSRKQRKTVSVPITRAQALCEGFIMSVLLGSTLVLVKGSLHTLGPITLVTLRYLLAALILLPFIVRRGYWRNWSARTWRHPGAGSQTAGEEARRVNSC